MDDVTRRVERVARDAINIHGRRWPLYTMRKVLIAQIDKVFDDEETKRLRDEYVPDPEAEERIG